jgi:hypothetical protein
MGHEREERVGVGEGEEGKGKGETRSDRQVYLRDMNGSLRRSAIPRALT